MQIRNLSLVLCLAVLGACSPEPSPTPAPAAQNDAPAQCDALLAPADAAIPTEAEAADAAAKAIDEKNADAELEKLKQEIQGGK